MSFVHVCVCVKRVEALTAPKACYPRHYHADLAEQIALDLELQEDDKARARGRRVEVADRQGMSWNDPKAGYTKRPPMPVLRCCHHQRRKKGHGSKPFCHPILGFR